MLIRNLPRWSPYRFPWGASIRLISSLRNYLVVFATTAMIAAQAVIIGRLLPKKLVLTIGSNSR